MDEEKTERCSECGRSMERSVDDGCVAYTCWNSECPEYMFLQFPKEGVNG